MFGLGKKNNVSVPEGFAGLSNNAPGNVTGSMTATAQPTAIPAMTATAQPTAQPVMATAQAAPVTTKATIASVADQMVPPKLHANMPETHVRTRQVRHQAKHSVPGPFKGASIKLPSLERAMLVSLQDITDIGRKFELITVLDSKISALLMQPKMLANLKIQLEHLQNEKRRVVFDPNENQMKLMIVETHDVQKLQEEIFNLYQKYAASSENIMNLIEERNKLLLQSENLAVKEITAWTEYLDGLLNV